ncbi:hypothetical protein Back11_45150 [Paenibacillus baekrokdamisoli]|uniref:Uncharacterized protein n=1 Tax=Paenibacillus baekrokdamisoli TaxID=1712516 RepID=A0A3G9IWE7_9BACL|nr:DUF1934 domain-containing protein [Paenibacillus baekrokdamisoli]MBB3072299.1 uncharacterized beta-barrel protein YwiB (DUF1934 family) [Paenibacillus baekrokdamisoli]BBH23170.1 hypothetical protein Back11_45150 [Paenibacillus baekrokdamisoli]
MDDRIKVRVTLESEIDGEKQSNVFSGEWFRKDRSIYVRYEETDEGGSKVRTIVRWRAGELSITRRGDVVSEQTFAPGERRSGQYESPHARFRLETETKLLWVQFGGQPEDDANEEQPKPSLPMLLEWHYTLWVEEQQTDDFILRLRAEDATTFQED